MILLLVRKDYCLQHDIFFNLFTKVAIIIYLITSQNLINGIE